jgi:hypothetical protein
MVGPICIFRGWPLSALLLSVGHLPYLYYYCILPTDISVTANNLSLYYQLHICEEEIVIYSYLLSIIRLSVINILFYKMILSINY